MYSDATRCGLKWASERGNGPLSLSNVFCNISRLSPYELFRKADNSESYKKPMVRLEKTFKSVNGGFMLRVLACD